MKKNYSTYFTVIIITVVSVYIVFLVLSPYLVQILGEKMRPKKDDDSAANIIAVIAAILTFFAFVMQYFANRIQKQHFNIQQFEARYFDFLNIYRNNVSDFSIHGYTQKSTFVVLRFEYERIFKITQKELSHLHLSKLTIANVSYAFLYFGIGERSSKMICAMCGKYIKEKDIRNLEKEFKRLEYDFEFLKPYLDLDKLKGFRLFNGHQRNLGHYYRHLYQTVKFVEKSQLSYEEKYGYIKMLRAQLSAQEVSLLFFHSLSALGYGWSKKKYKLGFTKQKISLIEKYDLIGNIPLDEYNILNPLIFYRRQREEWEWIEIKKYDVEKEFDIKNRS